MALNITVPTHMMFKSFVCKEELMRRKEEELRGCTKAQYVINHYCFLTLIFFLLNILGSIAYNVKDSNSCELVSCE